MPETRRGQTSPVAISEKARATLKRLAQALGIRQIDLLEHIINATDQHVAAHGGKMLIPFSFDMNFSIMPHKESRQILYEPPKKRAETK